MNYKDLANLIFSDAKDTQYYENLYPKRDLPEEAMVVRIGPSPTGAVHIGTIYQALIARMLANKTNGVFFSRIEDTDQKREVKNGVIEIIDSLQYFDLVPDEGMISESQWNGNYGPYKQSLRKEIYQAYAKRLIEEGLAYPCFATTEELNEMRKNQELSGVRPGYYGVWAKYRNLSIDDAVKKINNGEKFIIRFKSPGREDKKIKHKDIIKGNVIFPENDQDIVIIKADGLPTYHFAHVIDDHLMKTTHVIRGDEWLSSVPIHIQLFEALRFELPKYAHTATILKNDNGNKRKISKRKDPEASVSYYKEVGIPIDAVKEYLLNIANSNFEIWRKQNADKSISEFEVQLNKMSVSGALFDMIKLQDIGKNVISRYTAEEVYIEAYKWAKKYDNELLKLLNNKDYSIKIFNIERGKTKPRRDISKWSDVKETINYMYDKEFFENKENYEFDKINNKEEITKILRLYITKYYNENDSQEIWFDKIKNLAEELGYAKEVKQYKQNPENYLGHVGDISTVIRIGITKKKNTPDLYEIMQVLGKESIQKRINYII